jgi:hypothetical protein
LKLTDDEAGGSSEESEFVRKIAIELEPIQGSRADQYSQIIDGKPFLIKTRYQKDLFSRQGESNTLVKDYFFKKDSRELFIHDLLNVEEDSRYLEILSWEKA